MSSNNNGLVLVAVVVGVALVLKNKQALSAAVGRPVGSPQVPSRNLNGDMWARLLGTGWKNLLGSAAGSGAGGAAPFVMSDGYGGLYTSDGVPVGSGDPLGNWINRDTGLAPLYDNAAEYSTGVWTTGANPALAQTGPWADNVAGAYYGAGSTSTGLESVLGMFGGDY